jgi:CBS-domain-containing membrane protein
MSPESPKRMTNIVIPTGVVTYGTTVAEALAECVRCNVLGIPFVDKEARIRGRFSVGHTFKLACTPEMLILNADLLGDQLDSFRIPDNQSAELLEMPVDKFILDKVVTIHSSSPCVKAVALMQKYKTTYLFVVDDDGYKGVVNVGGIAKRMLEMRGL